MEEARRNEIRQVLEENGLLSYHPEVFMHVTSLVPIQSTIPFGSQVFVAHHGRLVECRIKVVSIMPGYYMSKEEREPFLRHDPKDVVYDGWGDAFQRARSLFVAEAANLDGDKFILVMPIDTMLFTSVESYRKFLMGKDPITDCCYIPDYKYLDRVVLYNMDGMRVTAIECQPAFACLDADSYHGCFPQLNHGCYKTREECVEANFDHIPVLRFGQDNTKGK